MKNNINKLNGVGFFDIKPGLERIKKVLSDLNNPQDKIKYIHIGGTNGKGSVASILSTILRSNGYKTGLYTSPHLVSVTERIKIDNLQITEEELEISLGEVFNACEELSIELSYFELVTAAAFLYFEKEKIDIGLLEVGMGGRWDATNVVSPLVSVITNISFDHTEHLGETKELIAKEKAEIIKENTTIVSGVTGNEQNILYEKARGKNANIYFLEVDFDYELTGERKFNYSGIYNKIENLSTNLAGEHQVINSTLSLGVLELLNKESGFDLDFEHIFEPLNNVNHDGRFEIVNVNPSVILDGAHNEAAADSLAKTLSEFCPKRKYVFLLSLLKDKNYEAFIEKISGNSEKIVITRIPNQRGAETDLLYNASKKFISDVEIIEDYKEAYEYVKKLNKPVCVTGSIYLVGMIKEYLGKSERDPEMNSG